MSESDSEVTLPREDTHVEETGGGEVSISLTTNVISSPVAQSPGDASSAENYSEPSRTDARGVEPTDRPVLGEKVCEAVKCPALSPAPHGSNKVPAIERRAEPKRAGASADDYADGLDSLGDTLCADAELKTEGVTSPVEHGELESNGIRGNYGLVDGLVDEQRVADPTLLKIKDLKPVMSSPWSFVAYIVARNPVREWKTFQGAGRLQEIFVSDSLHGCTRITLFDAAIDTFCDVVSPGATCYFAGGRAKRAFANKSEIEVSFGSNSVIRVAKRLYLSPLKFLLFVWPILLCHPTVLLRQQSPSCTRQVL